MIDLQEPLLEDGYWWVPENPEQQVAGRLQFDQEGGTKLEISGLLRSLSNSLNVETTDRETIHGITAKGHLITLLGCFRTSRRFGTKGFGREVYVVNLVAVGLHFQNAKEPLFSRSLFRFDGIERWLGRTPFESNFDFEARKVSVSTQSSRELHFATLPDQEITIGANIGSHPEGDTSMLVRAETVIVASAREPSSLDWHFANASKLQSLASL